VNIAVTASGSLGISMIGNSMSFKNVTTLGAVSTTTGSSTSLTQTVIAAPAKYVAQCFASDSTTLTTYNQTSEYNFQNLSNVSVIMGYGPASSSTSFTATAGSSSAYGGIAVPLS
jgi:hypothetical protein